MRRVRVRYDDESTIRIHVGDKNRFVAIRTDTLGEMQEFALLSFLIAQSYTMIMRVISKSILVTSFLDKRFGESMENAKKIYRTFSTRGLKISTRFKMSAVCYSFNQLKLISL